MRKSTRDFSFLTSLVLAWLPGLLVLLLPVITPHGASAQIYSEDFESQSVGDQSDDDNVWSLDASGADLSSSGDHFEIKERNSDLLLEGEDLDAPVVWETDQDPIDISGASNPGFSLVISETGDLESADYVDVEYSTDGGSTFTLIEDYDGLGSSSHTLVGGKPDDGDFGSVTVTQTGLSGTNLELRVTMENNSGSEQLRLDDVQVTDQTNPTVQFTSSGTTLMEDDGSTTLTVELQNADGSQVDADVAFQSGTSSASRSDIDGYSDQTITFSGSASNGDTKDVTVNLTDDSEQEGEETAEFALTNVSNGESTGGPFTLTIVDTEVVINEVLADPPTGSEGDANGDGTRSASDDEFIEIYNNSGSQLDLGGFSLGDDGSSTRHDFPQSTVLDPGEAVVVFGGGSPAASIPGIVQTATDGRLSLSNGGDDILVSDDSGNPYLTFSYGSEGGNDESLARDPDFTGDFVRHSNASGADGAIFSPGEQVGGSPLPVELTSLRVLATQGGARLTWQTISETNNTGFAVQHRAPGAEGWTERGFVEGAGTTTESQSYRFTTDALAGGTHTFRLKQVDTDGTAHFSEPQTVTIRAEAGLALSGPNPLPAGQTAELRVQVQKEQSVEVALYDVLGQRVRTVSTDRAAPEQPVRATISTEGLASGVYFLRASGSSFQDTQKVTVLR